MRFVHAVGDGRAAVRSAGGKDKLIPKRYAM